MHAVNGTREAERAGLLESWWSLLRRRLVVGLALFVPLFALAVALVFLARPIYRAEARLRLGEPPPMSGVSPTASILGFMRLGGDPFANDLELLSSRSLAEQIVLDRALQARLLAPRGWHRDSVFTRIAADTTTDDALYEIAWGGNDRVDVRMTAPRDSPVASGRPGEPLRFGGVELVVLPSRAGMPAAVELKTVPYALAVAQIGAQIRAERSRRDANVVDLSLDGPDPRLARDIVESVIDRFIGLRTALQQRESDQTVDSLRAVAVETQQELTEAENALESWQRETRLVVPDAQSEVFVGRYGQLLTAVEQTQLELDAIVAIVDRLETMPDTVTAWSTLLSHPAFLQSETMGLMLTQLTELEQKRVEMATRRAETSREYRLLVDQIRQLDGTLRSLARTHRAQLAERLGAMRGQVASMDQALAALPSQAIELGRRQRAIRLLSEIILLTEQRLRQEELRQALTFSNVQVIDPPALRYKPVWPRKKIGIGVGFLIAASFALLGMVVAERADARLRRATDIERIAHAPVLAVTLAQRTGLPSLSDPELRAVARSAAASNGAPGRVAVAPVEADTRAARVAQALANGSEPQQHGRVAVLEPLPAVDDFAAAAAADGGAVVLVVHYGRTRRDAVARSVRLLEAAGATVAGAIVVCERERDMTAVWS